MVPSTELLVKLMTNQIEDARQLVNKALKTNLQEFVQLTNNAIELLSKEAGHVGSFNITGRLVEVQPMGEAIVVGDVHGDLETLAQILQDSRFIEKIHAEKRPLLIFLGDYGDRGIYSPEVYYVVLKLKETYPEHIVLMRGNHEGPEDILASPHDLPAHLHRKFGEEWSKAYEKLRQLFDQLYNAVLVNEQCIMLHGGVPSQAKSIEDLAYAHKKHPNETHLEEILWSDPEEDISGTYPSPRGAGKLFGKDVTTKFLKMLNVKVLIRGHEPSEEGYKINHDGKILTLFSRKGEPYFNTQAAYLQLGLNIKVENAYQLRDSIKLL
jgi:protein phosphatase